MIPLVLWFGCQVGSAATRPVTLTGPLEAVQWQMGGTEVRWSGPLAAGETRGLVLPASTDPESLAEPWPAAQGTGSGAAEWAGPGRPLPATRSGLPLPYLPRPLVLWDGRLGLWAIGFAVLLVVLRKRRFGLPLAAGIATAGLWPLAPEAPESQASTVRLIEPDGEAARVVDAARDTLTVDVESVAGIDAQGPPAPDRWTGTRAAESRWTWQRKDALLRAWYALPAAPAS
ncbi:MAG: hypothetical protein R3E96_06350 [Planctomycetota bacterium]